ncbi:S8 family serine peptidase [Bacillus altitudinis]|uniref:S8 family serine peptidase n=1 Tax=Bacillus altitudinis TaxID=293387 RepID=UPI001F21AB68|nr:S8 family serine peptidase [Bacillus altitudinis]
MILPNEKIEITKTQPVKITVLDSGIEQNIPQIKKHIKNTYNAIDRTSETKPFFPHGTMIASILTNTQIKNTKIGITENTNLYDIQVLDEHGKGDPSDTIEGIEWSIKQGVDIINLSFGFAKDDSRLKAAIEKAHLRRFNSKEFSK